MYIDKEDFKKKIGAKPILVLDYLKKSEWSTEFETLMRNRLMQGAFRYGKLSDPTKPMLNRTKSIQKRLEFYNALGNKEHLVDIANLCLVEFELSEHPDSHFKTIDDGEHLEETNR